jgi:2-polyprenyl-3-methyl-5-hydroxy-6-metoxy-1,4-benzoquinol methylase
MLRKLWFTLAYIRRPVWDTDISPHELQDYITTHQPGRALDLGCGTGTNVITLAKHGWDVVGVDFAKHAINLAKKKAQRAGVEVDLRHENVTQLDSIKSKFNLILDMGCFHSLPSNKRVSYILKIDQLLTDTGTFLLYLFYTSTADCYGLGASKEDIRFITQKFRVMEQKDSTERGIRPSTWFTLQRNI